MYKQRSTTCNNGKNEEHTIAFLFGMQREKDLDNYLQVRKQPFDKPRDVDFRKTQTKKEICEALLLKETLAFCDSPYEFSRSVHNNSHIENMGETDITIAIDHSIYRLFYEIYKDQWENFCIRMIRYGIDELTGSIRKEKTKNAKLSTLKDSVELPIAEYSVKKLLAGHSLSEVNERIKILKSNSNWGETVHHLQVNPNRKRDIIQRIYKDLLKEYPNVVNYKDSIVKEVGVIYGTINSKKLSEAEHEKETKKRYLEKHLKKIASLEP